MSTGPNLEDDTVVEPLPDAVMETVAGGNSDSSCVECCSCSMCSMGPDLEPAPDARST